MPCVFANEEPLKPFRKSLFAFLLLDSPLFYTMDSVDRRDREVSSLLKDPLAAVKASLSDPPYTESEEIRVSICSLPFVEEVKPV